MGGRGEFFFFWRLCFKGGFWGPPFYFRGKTIWATGEKKKWFFSKNWEKRMGGTIKNKKKGGNFLIIFWPPGFSVRGERVPKKLREKKFLFYI